jgi:uncharacterized repeat protein (TIGR01451 family)
MEMSLMSTQKIEDARFVKIACLGAMALLFILGLAIIVSAQGENLLDHHNSGFETPSPANWESRDANLPIPLFWWYSWPPNPVHGGGHSVGITITWSTYEGWWESTPAIPITTTGPYTFSGWIKTADVGDQACLTLIFLDATGDEIMTVNSRAVDGSTDWVQVSPQEPVMAPGNAAFARMRCRLLGSGTAWCDDIVLRTECIEFADLEMEKSVHSPTVKAGEQLTYTLKYRNIGNVSAREVVITDVLPPSVTLVSSNPAADDRPDAHTLVWDDEIGDLAANGVFHTITVVVTVSNTTMNSQWLTNTATIAAQNADPETARVTTEVTPSPKLTIKKMSDSKSGCLSVNDTLHYTLTYQNVGGAVARGVWLTDTLPLGVTPVSASPGWTEWQGRTLLWKLDDLRAMSQEQTIVVTIRVNPSAQGQVLHNDAEITSQETEANDDVEVCVNPVTDWLIYLPSVMKNYCPPFANGDFENGWTGWTHDGALVPSISPDDPHSGHSSVLLGKLDYVCTGEVPTGSAWIEQTFWVPATDSPTLTFWYNLFTQDKNPLHDDTHDIFEVKINGVQVYWDMNTTEPTRCGTPINPGWKEPKTGPIDLTPYRGSCITLRFENWNRPHGSYNTWTYIDDVQLLP